MHEPGGAIHFVADRGDTRLPLDQVLVRRVREISRLTRLVAQEWIAAGAVTVDGLTALDAEVRVAKGAVVTIAVPAAATRRVRPQPEAIPLDVLYEDATVIAVNKPPGMVVHPSYKQPSGTLLNAVLWRVRDRPDAQPGILTRLDKDTSGLVIVALSPGVHASLQRDATAGHVVKHYLAIVTGSPHPPSGRITMPLARDPLDRRRVIATDGGAASETRYEVIAASPSLALVRCEPITGRTHQIRVHLAASGWPILGDRVYAVAHPAIARQALHARRAKLPHPATREPIAIEAPVPEDMKAIARLFDRHIDVTTKA
jgi:23S rRNA pseudouridine1911/1915/1917 synthase